MPGSTTKPVARILSFGEFIPLPFSRVTVYKAARFFPVASSAAKQLFTRKSEGLASVFVLNYLPSTASEVFYKR
jgi:hypothetical protein